MATVKKAQKGTKLTTKRVREVADSLEDVGYKKIAASVSGRTKPAEKLQDLTKSGWSDIDNSKRYKKLADKAEGKKSMKSGGKVKDKKWIQKAVNPAHKGYCTPMTKATCTPKRKALAMTFKRMAAKRKSK